MSIQSTPARRSPACALAVIGLAAACSGSPAASPAGSYTLARVNGVAVPYTQPRSLNAPGACRATVVRGSLAVQPEGRFSLDFDARDACNQAGIVNTTSSVEHAEGTLARQGNVLRFTATGADSTPIMTGPLLGDTLSLYYRTRRLTFTFVRVPKAAKN